VYTLVYFTSVHTVHIILFNQAYINAIIPGSLFKLSSTDIATTSAIYLYTRVMYYCLYRKKDMVLVINCDNDDEEELNDWEADKEEFIRGLASAEAVARLVHLLHS
jgi:hypothetical protein